MVYGQVKPEQRSHQNFPTHWCIEFASQALAAESKDLKIWTLTHARVIEERRK